LSCGCQTLYKIDDSLGPDGMSDDESEHHGSQKCHVIYQDKWESPTIMEWIWKFDLISFETKLNELGQAT
jgi:hypothetical protein